MDLVALKAEIETDPESLGYAGKTHEEIAKLLNRPDREADQELISGGQIAATIHQDDYNGLSQSDRRYLELVVGSGGDIPNRQPLRGQLRGLFPQGSDTDQKIQRLLKRPGSRADELGLGRVTPSDVANAMRA